MRNNRYTFWQKGNKLFDDKFTSFDERFDLKDQNT